jgi:DNA modification methylase
MNKKAEGKVFLFESKDLRTYEDGNKGKLVLFDNVQFIYELALAKLELLALGINFEITDKLREFNLLNSKGIDSFIKKTAYFKIVDGKYSDYFYIIQKNVTRSVNQYLTHWIYPYKGKFHPQMIRALINIIGLKENDRVLDPFIGSGTTAVEAMLLGINCIGVDVSPLCVIQSRVKTESIEVIEEIENVKKIIIQKNSFKFFDKENKNLLNLIDSIENEKVRNFYKLAYLISVSDKERRNRKFEQSFYKNMELMIRSIKDFSDIVSKLNLKLGKVEIIKGDARNLDLEDNSIDGIITSPPYSIALDYVSNDAHSLKVIGYEPLEIREDFIGVRGRGIQRINLYNEDMKKSYKEMFRVLKPGKFVVIILGNAVYQGQEIKTVEFTIDYCKQIGFKLINNIDKIIFGLYNVMQKENILIFQKP